MGAFMSKKSKKRKHNDEITDVDRAVLSLKTQKRKLNSDRKRLEEVIEKNLAAVKELLAQKDNTKALLALKKKKMREDQLKNVDNWLLHVEELLNTIEFSQQQDSVIAALKVGSDALKDIQKEVGPPYPISVAKIVYQITMEDIDRLTEDTEEAKAYLEEVQQALGRDSAEDIAELEAELKAIEDEFVEKEKKDFPHVPETQPVRVQPEAANKEADEVEKKVADKVADEIADKVADKVAKEVANEVAKEVANEVAKEVANEVAKEVADEVADEIANEIAEEGEEPLLA